MCSGSLVLTVVAYFEVHSASAARGDELWRDDGLRPSRRGLAVKRRGLAHGAEVKVDDRLEVAGGGIRTGAGCIAAI